MIMTCLPITAQKAIHFCKGQQLLKSSKTLGGQKSGDESSALMLKKNWVNVFLKRWAFKHFQPRRRSTLMSWKELLYLEEFFPAIAGEDERRMTNFPFILLQSWKKLAKGLANKKKRLEQEKS